MDLSVFTAAIGGLQQTIQGAKALLELKVDAATAARINALLGELGDLTGKFLAAQTAHMTCQERNVELEKEVARLKAFEAEKERYQLQELGPGGYAYTLREALRGEEPVHSLCCQCYADNTKSILQFSGNDHRDRILRCPRCKAEVRMPHGLPGVAVATSDGSSRRMF